jgi:ubiquinone/menaquinone biosynthesis C-methylase UbiE
MLDVRGRDVLDIGCGEGWLVRWLGEHGAASATGVDPLDVALERAREQDPAGAYAVGGAQSLPFDDAGFDTVVFFNSLHHVPVERMDDALREAVRVLRPGGELYVQEPLPAGPFFELMRPVDDETAVRAAAQDALDRAVAAGLVHERERRDAALVMRLPDFDAWRRLVESVEPSRLAAVDAHHAELHEAFHRLGRTDGDGLAFEQPVRVRLLVGA